MKNFLLSTIYVILSFTQASSQQIFQNVGCSTLEYHTNNCPTVYDYPINVSGVGLIDQTYGLNKVLIDMDQPIAFDVKLQLVSPSGGVANLASAEEGILSFPQYVGTNYGPSNFLQIGFQPCPEHPLHNDNVPLYTWELFQPIDNFYNYFNEGYDDADGTWYLRVCSFGDPYEVYCAELHFDYICPVILDVVTISPPTCSDSFDGSIAIANSTSSCSDVTYSIDGINFQDGADFFGLGSGTYTAYVQSASTFCYNSFPFTLDYEDNVPPTVYCSTSFDVYYGEGCVASWSLADADYEDNCIVSTANVTISYPNGSSGTYAMVPGFLFDYSYSGGEEGLVTYEFVVTDESGNTTECTVIVNLINPGSPDWTSAAPNINLTGECGINNIDDLISQALDQLDANIASNYCGTSTVSIISENTTNGDCPSISFDGTYALNYNGLQNPEFATVHIELFDTEPPVISGVPSNVQIGCFDAFPDVPTPTAFDFCLGDITNAIQVTSSFATGTCAIDEVAVIYAYTWTVQDGCGNQTSESWEVTVVGDQEMSLGDDIVICPGENTTLQGSGSWNAYTWSDGSSQPTLTVNAEGTYSLYVTTNSGCCFEDAINVSIAPSPMASATGGSITCDQNSVTLMGSSDISGSTFSWTGPNGFSSSLQNPSVGAEGTYELIVTSPAGCTASATAEVTADSSLPDVMATGGTLTCTNTSLTLTSSSNTPNVTFNWTGPNGFNSTDMNVEVNVAGSYIITVTSENGCSASSEVTVASNTTAPTVSVPNATIDCQESSVILNPSGSSNVTYSWTGPNGFSSTDMNPEVSTAGTYTVIVTASNGCTGTATSMVTNDTNAPQISAVGGEINCNNPTVTIQTTGSDQYTYNWVGPNGFTANTKNITVSNAGQYTLTATSANGCQSTVSVDITSNTTKPSVSVEGGTLDCNTTTLTISPDVNANVSYVWTGPNGFSATTMDITVNTPGTYNLIVTAENGCTSSAKAVIMSDKNVPSIDIKDATIDCNASSVVLTPISSVDLEYNWSGPNGFSSTEENPEVSNPGEYTLIVTADNGCTNSSSVIVELDADAPQGSLDVADVNCQSGAATLIFNTNGSYTYSWLKDGVELGQDPSIEVSEPGIYSVLIGADNGCNLVLSYSLPENIGNLQAFIETTNATTTVGGTANISFAAGPKAETIEWDNGNTGTEATDLSVGTHTVTVTDIFGCEYTYTFNIEMESSLNELEYFSEISIYPTISQRNINLRFVLNDYENVSMLIYTSLGELVVQEDFKNIKNYNGTVNIEDYSPGVYLLGIRINGKIFMRRFVKIN
ncbi:MAG TPA: T9SS type A sorting domain-containing protein [Saprospiraceae bacterium]|nr:T9SS type A sorting domain-containing protein [Saprospiraceae bacterium]